MPLTRPSATDAAAKAAATGDRPSSLLRRITLRKKSLFPSKVRSSRWGKKEGKRKGQNT